MAMKRVSVFTPLSATAREKIDVLSTAVDGAARAVGFSRFGIPLDALLDFPPVVKELHAGWTKARAEFTKKKYAEDGAINAGLVVRNDVPTIEYWVMMGTPLRRSAPEEPPRIAWRREKRVQADLTIWMSDDNAELIQATRRAVRDAAAAQGLDFAFPWKWLLRVPAIGALKPRAEKHADTIFARFGFTRQPHSGYLFLAKEGRVGFRFMSDPSSTAQVVDEFDEEIDDLDFSVLRLHCTETMVKVARTTTNSVTETIAETAETLTGETAQATARSLLERLWTFLRNLFSR